MGPLSHIRVIEVANVIAGPYTGMMLADMGADVVKVEAPGEGDLFRTWSKGSYSPNFIAYNRSKRSVTLNLKDPTGVDLFRKLIEKADVLIENLRPGVMDRLGIGHRALAEINPRLVYCSITGFGDSGPYVKRPAYDGVIQALSGVMSEVTDVQNPWPIGPALSDHLSGLYAIQGILAGLVQRDHSGQGQYISVPMVAASMSLIVSPLTRHFMLNEKSGPSARSRVSQTYAFVCADGKAFIAHLSSPKKFWAGLVTVAGRPDMADDPRYPNREARTAQYEDIREQLQVEFRKQPREYWLQRLAEADVPCAPINTIADALDDPQIQHLGLQKQMTWPDDVPQVGRLDTIGLPISFAGTPAADPVAPPPLGAHTTEILAELGVSEAEVEDLRSRQVI